MSIPINRCKDILKQLEQNKDWNFLVNKKLFCTSYALIKARPVSTVPKLFNTSDNMSVDGLLETWFTHIEPSTTDDKLIDIAISNLACIIAFDRLATKFKQLGEFHTDSGAEIEFERMDIDIDNAGKQDEDSDIAFYVFTCTDTNGKMVFLHLHVKLMPLEVQNNQKYLDRDCKIAAWNNRHGMLTDIVSTVGSLNINTFKNLFNTISI